METEPEASVPASLSKNRIRIEVSVLGENFAHEVTTDVFLRGIQVNRRADEVRWRMDCVRIVMSEENARDVIGHSLAMLPHDDQFAIIGAILEELQRCGYRFRRS